MYLSLPGCPSLLGMVAMLNPCLWVDLQCHEYKSASAGLPRASRVQESETATGWDAKLAAIRMKTGAPCLAPQLIFHFWVADWVEESFSMLAICSFTWATSGALGARRT